MNDIKIIKKADELKPFIIIDKAAGLPSAPLFADDKENVLNKTALLFPQILKVKGNKEIEHGLLHRLDTATSGLLIIAANQACYDFLYNEQKEGRIIKKYRAKCSYNKQSLPGFPPLPKALAEQLKNLQKGSQIIVSSYFRHYGKGRKEVRPVTEESSKTALLKMEKPVLYTTKITIIDINPAGNSITTECQISNGFRHQVRCHLAWCGLSIEGDSLYNPQVKNKSAEELKFCATSLSFEYPRGDLNSYDRKDTWT